MTDAVIRASAPGRCGLVGNPTDMYGGSVISCSTHERAVCKLEPLTEGNGIELEFLPDHQILASDGDLAAQGNRLDIAKAVLRGLGVDPTACVPFKLSGRTAIPMQAGLAGSTALIAAAVGCVLEFLDKKLNRYATAELIRSIEYFQLGVVCGYQDHYMATFGGLNYMDFRDKCSIVGASESSPYATIEPLNGFVGDLPFVLAHTGNRHHSGTVHNSIRERWVEGEKTVVEGYIEIAEMARVAKKALLAGDLQEVARLMNANHAIQRDLGGSGDANEELIKAAMEGGAWGAKLAGAGGGGTIIAIGPDRLGLAAHLEDAGADAILFPAPALGLTVDIE